MVEPPRAVSEQLVRPARRHRDIDGSSDTCQKLELEKKMRVTEQRESWRHCSFDPVTPGSQIQGPEPASIVKLTTDKQWSEELRRTHLFLRSKRRVGFQKGAGKRIDKVATCHDKYASHPERRAALRSTCGNVKEAVPAPP